MTQQDNFSKFNKKINKVIKKEYLLIEEYILNNSNLKEKNIKPNTEELLKWKNYIKEKILDENVSIVLFYRKNFKDKFIKIIKKESSIFSKVHEIITSFMNALGSSKMENFLSDKQFEDFSNIKNIMDFNKEMYILSNLIKSLQTNKDSIKNKTICENLSPIKFAK